MNHLRLFRSSAFLVLSFFVALVLTRCGQQGAAPPSGTFSNVYQVTLKPACISCHAPNLQGPEAHVNLDVTTQAKAYQGLVNVAVSGDGSGAACKTLKVVLAGNTAKSYLAGVLFQDLGTTNNFGGVGCTPITRHHEELNLSASERTSILAWITAGAKND